MKTVYLSLGSNLGDRRGHIERALARLGTAGVQVLRVSSFYRTEPVGYAPQPWFLNCAAEVATSLMPFQLLRRCQAIQLELGRRPGPRNGPRVIDIDVLFYEGVKIRSAEMTVPHPRMTRRRFVLVPLRELAAGAGHPLVRQTVREVLPGLSEASQAVKLYIPPITAN